MTTRISTTARDAAANAVADLFDAGAGAGTIKIYSGSQPATPQSAPTGVLLATLTFSDPAFGAAVTGVVAADTISDDSSVDATNTAGWFRCADSDGNAILDGSVGLTGSGAQLEFDVVDFVIGGVCAISSFEITVPM